MNSNPTPIVPGTLKQLSMRQRAAVLATARALLNLVETEQVDIAPGEYDLSDFELSCQVRGFARKESDTERTSTCSIPLYATLAYFAQSFGATREAVLKNWREALIRAMTAKTPEEVENLSRDFKEQKRMLETEIVKRLPKTAVRGAFKISDRKGKEGVKVSAFLGHSQGPRRVRRRVAVAGE